jgi:hypothetical protein
MAPVFEQPEYVSAHALVIEVRLFRHKKFSIDYLVTLPVVRECSEIG